MDTTLLQIFSPANIFVFMAVFVRIGGMFTSAPLYSTYPIPTQVKIWLTAFIAFIIYPLVQAHSHFMIPSDVPGLTCILIKEFSIGFIIGFCANLVFLAAELGANMFSIQMGLSISQALNPASGTNSPIISQAFTLLITMVFIGLNAHQWLLSSVYSSFAHVPIGYSFIFNGAMVQKIIYMTGQMFVIAIGIAIPIFSVLLIKDILLGFVSKLMPTMNIFMVAMPLKVYVGLLLCMIFMRPIAEYTKIILEKVLTEVSAVF
ncbi:flagellar biosynthetic protein FliR [bacterium]|nr:flagellar biosynthetic protein FliR [bacterium]